MAEIRKDALSECLFDRKDARLINVKFFRGSEDVISESEFRAQAHAAIVQKNTGTAVKSALPRSERPKVNIREMVSKI